jgi:hypothetical protein
MATKILPFLLIFRGKGREKARTAEGQNGRTAERQNGGNRGKWASSFKKNADNADDLVMKFADFALLSGNDSRQAHELICENPIIIICVICVPITIGWIYPSYQFSLMRKTD